jgi:hypothetical protein
MQPLSPIQSASEFDDPAFESTQNALVPTQIIDTGDTQDNSSAIIEPWDAVGSPSPSLISGDDFRYGSPVPPVARQLSLPPVVYVEGTPSVQSSARSHRSPRENPIQSGQSPPCITTDDMGDVEHLAEPEASPPKEHQSTTPSFAGDDCEV